MVLFGKRLAEAKIWLKPNMETLQRTANRGSVSTGYDIDNSCKFEPDNSESMSRTPSGNGNLKTCTLSFWVKITELNKSHMFFTGDYGGAANPWFVIGLISDRIYISSTAGVSGASVVPSRLLRDTSAWYHLVFAFDTTQGTAADRIKIYVNGVQETVFTSTTYPSQNDDLDIMAAKAQGIAGYNDGTDYRFAGYMSEFVGIDGQALAPTEFGEFDEDSGIWKPIDVSGLTFGTNGFYLDFKDSANLGNDASGGTDFTETNIAAADQAVDTPTNNFAMLSSAMHDVNELSYSTISEGGTLFRVTTASKWVTAVSSIGVTKGKWYAEFVVSGARPNNWWGIASMEQLNNNSGYSSAGSHLGESGKNWSIGYYQSNGKLDKQQNSGYTTTASWGAAVSQNQVVGVALDMDNHKLYMAVNNTYQASGNPVTAANPITFDATETVAIATTGYSLGGGNDTITVANFGGYKSGGMYSQATDGNGYGGFRYAPPTGYYALCTKNLAEYG